MHHADFKKIPDDENCPRGKEFSRVCSTPTVRDAVFICVFDTACQTEIDILTKRSNVSEKNAFLNVYKICPRYGGIMQRIRALLRSSKPSPSLETTAHDIYVNSRPGYFQQRRRPSVQCHSHPHKPKLRCCRQRISRTILTCHSVQRCAHRPTLGPLYWLEGAGAYRRGV